MRPGPVESRGLQTYLNPLSLCLVHPHSNSCTNHLLDSEACSVPRRRQTAVLPGAHQQQPGELFIQRRLLLRLRGHLLAAVLLPGAHLPVRHHRDRQIHTGAQLSILHSFLAIAAPEYLPPESMQHQSPHRQPCPGNRCFMLRRTQQPLGYAANLHVAHRIMAAWKIAASALCGLV